jgi:Na+-driven multidrug efflux pump
VIILPIALEIFTANFGFLGSAMAYVCFQAIQTILLLLYLWWKQPQTTGTWPGLGCWREALKYKPMMEYLHLGAGGILAQSEWIYWEALGLIVGKMGVLQLSVHTIPNQVVMAMAMTPFAAGISLSIRMGVTLSQSVQRTKMIVAVTVLVSSLVSGIVSIVIFFKSRWIFAIFTTDEQVMGLAQSVWWKVCTFNFNVSIFAILCGVATGLGQQWTLGAVNFFFLWIFGLPVTYYFALVRGGGLDAAWTWINVPYACMNLSLLAIFVTADWHKVRDKIQERIVADPSTELESQTHPTYYATSDEQKGLLNDAFRSDYGVIGGIIGSAAS